MAASATCETAQARADLVVQRRQTQGGVVPKSRVALPRRLQCSPGKLASCGGFTARLGKQRLYRGEPILDDRKRYSDRLLEFLDDGGNLTVVSPQFALDHEPSELQPGVSAYIGKVTLRLHRFAIGIHRVIAAAKPRQRICPLQVRLCQLYSFREFCNQSIQQFEGLTMKAD